MKLTIRNFLLLSLFFLSACQGTPPRKLAATSLPRASTALPVATSTSQPTATQGEVQVKPNQPTAAPEREPAVETVELYAAALMEGNYESAAELLSSFSLMVAQMTRSEAASEVQTRMAREKWSDFQSGETSVFNTKTVLVRVTYQVEMKDENTGQAVQSPVEALWPVRLENGKWLLNRDLLIDFHTLDVPAQTTAGLTVKPRQLTRYSDGICLTLLAQNQTNEPIVLGQVNEILATFLFGEQKIEAEKTRFIFDRLRSYPDVVIEVKGQFDQYPDGIIIRQWKNYNVAPWFTFEFSQ